MDIDDVYFEHLAKAYHPMMLNASEKRIGRLADLNMSNCGCAYEAYLNNFSQSVDELLASEKDEARRATIVYVARKNDYMSPEQISQMQRDLIESGLCIHGIDLDCCPAGCGG